MREATVVTLWGGKDQSSPYLTRVGLFGDRLKLHVFHRSDNDPDCHDHPADFWTFPLTSYVEMYRDANRVPRYRVVRAFRFHRRKAEFAHMIVGRWIGQGRRCYEAPIVTITWWGKKRREWGFWTKSGKEFVHWRDYVQNPID